MTQTRMTKRQAEILLLRANGKPNVEIARVAGISKYTVSETLTDIYRRLGARDCAHAVAIALCLNEIDPYDVDIPQAESPVRTAEGVLMRRILNNSQIRVLMAARDGGTLEEIGQRIGMSRGMVSSRFSEIYKRLEISWMETEERRAAAIRRADGLGLLPDRDTPAMIDIPHGEFL